MTTKVLVPRLGEGVEEVTITRWLKQEGDSVKELEPLLEVNTDKVNTEIPAPASGVILKIEMQAGQPAKVGQLLALIGTAGESIPASSTPRLIAPGTQPGAERSVSASTPSTVNRSPSADLGFISPVVAKIAGEKGIDLSQIPGTGLNGRITKKDVLNFIASPETRPEYHSTRTVQHATPIVTPSTGDSMIKHTLIRRQIADHMVMSKSVSPHVLTVMETDMSLVVKNRTANKPAFERDEVNLTLTAYFMMAIVAGLKAYPIVNSSWTDDGLLLHKNINIGMATSLGEEGLIVPVIKGADTLSLLGMARTVNDLASRARARKLQPNEVKGGTFTLTNHGISGSLFAMPIINQPQCGILGVGAMQKRAVAVEDAIAIRPMVYLSFVFDHRILDGASADWFLAKVKETLENWN
jgi:pyruvate/2-oxoglutarate dehydrogenase complex dihydrolipoamide acyltransferase (E2) component